MSQNILETPRLLIRSFFLEDLPAIHRILEQTFGAGDKGTEDSALQERRSWLQWSILNQEWFPKLHQPPYGDRAVVLNKTGKLIGSVGYVPMLDVYDQIPELANAATPSGFTTPEFGLFWVIDPQYQRKGYATEAAQAMIATAFTEMKLKRIIATTDYSNLASQGVMHKLGMNLSHNPSPQPSWLQVVGILENGNRDEQ